MDQYTFPIERFMPQFSLRRTRRRGPVFSGHGPSAVCYREQLVAWAKESHDLGAAVPVDVFALGWGEAPFRDMTKFGGLPYRPAGLPWPRSKESGEELTFVAQLRFAQSKDLMPPLPGDILLCFFEDYAAAPFDWFPGPPVFEWYPLGLRELIGAEDVPSAGFDVPECYGLRYRTCDYAEERAMEAIRGSLPPRLCEFYEYADEARMIATWNVTKIGGKPSWPNPKEISVNFVEPGPFLATLAPILEFGEYPWVNSREECFGQFFAWSEEGAVQLFLDQRGNVVPRIQLFGEE